MHQRLDGLYLAQAGLNHDPLFHITAIPLRRAGKRLKYHWQRGQGGQLRAVLVGREYRIPLEALAEWLEGSG